MPFEQQSSNGIGRQQGRSPVLACGRSILTCYALRGDWLAGSSLPSSPAARNDVTQVQQVSSGSLATALDGAMVHKRKQLAWVWSWPMFSGDRHRKPSSLCSTAALHHHYGIHSKHQKGADMLRSSEP